MLLSAGLLLMGEGCASVSIVPKDPQAATAPAPRRIVVADFTYASQPGGVRVDRQGEQLQGFERDLTRKMRGYLAKYLARFDIPVEEASGGRVPPGPPGWLVTGEFTRVNQGSRALRVIVGVGLGGTKMQTDVRVADIKTGRMICDFGTTGGSNAEPGLITSAGPANVAAAGGAAFTLVTTSIHGVTEDARRTAKMIADYISEQLATNGALQADKARQPKMLAGPVNLTESLRN